MFEEEYYVPIVPKNQQAENGAESAPLVYKYFAELSPEQIS